MTENSTVYVVDDDPGALESLRWMLEQADYRVKAFHSSRQFLDSYRPGEPGCLVLDVRMPEMDGLEATRQITGGNRAAGSKVVMLTTFDFDDYVYEALRAGASGFLLKDAPRHDLIAAVRTVAAGNALLAPSVTMRLIDAFARRPAQTLPAPSRLASLTGRERDILLRLARGLTNAEIAADLVVSEATVKSHVGNLLAKLGLRDRVQAVILAYETGVVVPGDP